MPSLKEFVDALQAGWFPALVAFLGCSLGLAGNWYHVPYLTDAPAWLTTTAAAIDIFAISILSAKLIYAPIAAIKTLLRWRKKKAWALKIRGVVEDAPYDEKSILAYLVTTGRRAFAAKLDDRRLVPLVAKGMIERISGRHNALEWPHLVQDDVWDYLCENKERFVYKDASEAPDPFHWLHNRW